MKNVIFGAAALAVAAGVANAQVENWSGSVSFTTDFGTPSQNIILPSFDTTGGRILTGVLVEWCWSGSVDIAGDNDDDFKKAAVNARMVRTFQGTGPGTFAFGNRTDTTATVDLDEDNGDDGVFDSTGPDGVAFGTLSFGPLLANSNNPANALYATAGPSTVAFTAQSLLMVNDQQFSGVAPDQWQLEVQNPIMTIEVKLTYTYIPAPGALALAGMGLVAAGRRRR